MAKSSISAVKVMVVGYYENYPPGIIECSLQDRFGRDWRVTVKQYDASENDLDANSSYPVSGSIECLIVSRETDGSGKDTVIVELGVPLTNLTEDGVDRFDIFADQLV